MKNQQNDNQPPRTNNEAQNNSELVYAYTRAQALADGFQVDVSTTAREAGITFPVYMNRTVWTAYVEVPLGVTAQDERGRLWDIVWMLRFAIMKSTTNPTRLPFALYVRNDNTRPKLIKLVAECGPRDINDPQPAITIMLPDED